MPKRVPLPPDLAPFSVSEGRAAGLGEKRMRNADLTRPFSGARSTAHAADLGARVAVVSACKQYLPLMRPDQYFTHTTAAMLWGCPLSKRYEVPLPLHITSLRTYSVRRPEIVGHRAGVVSLIPAVRLGLPTVAAVSVFLQLASMLELDDLVAVADHLVLDPPVLDPHDVRPYLTLAALTEGAAKFRGRGARAAASALRLCRPGAESRRETQLRLLLLRAGFPEPEVNADLYSERGRWLGRWDLVFRRWKVVVEYDGDHHRTDTAQYEKDILRTERLEQAGWIVVKVRSRGLGVHTQITVARVERALTSRGWRR